MNSSIVNLLFQLLPIALGVAILVSLRSMNFVKRYAILHFQDEPGSPGSSASELPEANGFKEFAYGELIINGIFEGRKNSIEHRAMSELLLVSALSLHRLSGAFNPRNHDILKVAVSSYDDAASTVCAACSYSKAGGILLSYMINYKLDIEVITRTL
ncbi:MAG: hypothetical protein ACP5K9_00855 [Candidatus Micrarchaeia archaeon]